MKDTTKVNAKSKNQSNVKHDKDLYPAKAHVTIVRPREQEHKKNWIIRVNDEKGKMIRSYEYDNSIVAEEVYKNLLKAQTEQDKS